MVQMKIDPILMLISLQTFRYMEFRKIKKYI